MQTSQVGTPHARIFNEATKHHFARISDESTRSDLTGILEHMFEDFSADALVGEIEASLRQESALMARRCAVIAALLALRTGEAEDADPDPGYALITGFARTTAEVSATMNMSPMGAQHWWPRPRRWMPGCPTWPRCWPPVARTGAPCR